MIFDNAAKSTSKSREKAQQATNEVSSGMRVVHPGDDPAAAGLLSGHRISESRFDALVATTGRASDELSAADQAFAGLSELMTRSRELAIQYANSTYSGPQREVAAEEVKALFRHSISLLNTRVDNRYIFAGNLDSTPPFDNSGQYHGDEGIRRVEIAPGVVENGSVRADIVAKGVGGGVDALATVQSLITALESNDVDAIRDTLDPLDTAITQTANGRARAGAILAVLDSANLAARTARDTEKSNASREADSDVFESASRMALAQRALDATLTASAQSFQLTLLNKIR